MQVSTGSTQSPDNTGKRIPAYAPTAYAMAQKQSLTADDLKQLDGLNIQGVQEALYMNGNIEGLIRLNQRGGDLVTMTEGRFKGDVYLTTHVLERWPDWCKIAVTLQMAPPVVVPDPVRVTSDGALRSTSNESIRSVAP